MDKAILRMRIARERKNIKKQILKKGFAGSKLKKHAFFRQKVALRNVSKLKLLNEENFQRQ